MKIILDLQVILINGLRKINKLKYTDQCAKIDPITEIINCFNIKEINNDRTTTH